MKHSSETAGTRHPGPGTGERLRTLLRRPVFWIGFLCVAVMSLFYAHLDGGGQFSCLLADRYAAAFHYTMQRMVLYPDSVKYAASFSPCF